MVHYLVLPNKDILLIPTFKRKVDLSDIDAHKACNDFYQQKFRERRVLDGIEQEYKKSKSRNKHCHNKNCTKNCICIYYNCNCDNDSSCPCDRDSLIKDWDKGYVSLWIDRCKQKDSMYELDCTHGRDCQRINKCNTCTPQKLCVPPGEREKVKNSNKKKNGKEPETLGEELQRQQKYQRQRTRADNWNPLDPEDLET
jgi:hypothetical protein